jgi:hypothetical protein
MLKKEIVGFARGLYGLRDFVDLIDPILNEKQKEIETSRQHLLDPVRRILTEKVVPDTNSEETVDFDKDIVTPSNIKIEIVNETKGTEGETTALTFKVSGEDSHAFQETINDLTRVQKRKNILYQSSLMNLTNTVEWFLSQILHKYFETYPNAIGSKENVFSLDDLKGFNTIEDARQHLIETKVENILRDNFDAWIKFLKENVKLSMSYLEKNKSQIVEVFQRRNLIVHNGGKVNSIYLSKVVPEFKENVSIGDEILISRKYLDDSIGLFEEMFILIAAELWKQQSPADEDRATILAQIAYEHLSKERWRIAEGLSFFSTNDKGMSEIYQLYGKLNYWQSVKWQGRYEEIKKDVDNADFSGKGLLLQLALYALQDKTSEFFRLLPEVISESVTPSFMGHKLTCEELETFPIFREMRKDPSYSEFKSENAGKFAAFSDASDQESADNEDVKDVESEVAH